MRWTQKTWIAIVPEQCREYLKRKKRGFKTWIEQFKTRRASWTYYITAACIISFFFVGLYSATFRRVNSNGSPSSDMSLATLIRPASISDTAANDDYRYFQLQRYEKPLEMILEEAALPDVPSRSTVIITTLNAAWAERNTSMIDIFLESFQNGEGTSKLLKHLIVACFDHKAYDRCLQVHPHCIKVKTEGLDFSGEQAWLSRDYIKMIWRRIEFLIEVLEMNYSFIFTDTDILWFRDPFLLLEMDSQADFQMACDRYNGRPADVSNKPNAGFTYVRANERTLQFYKYWYRERIRDPRMADQEIFNVIKYEDEFKQIGIRIRFLDTQFIGGICALRTTDMAKVYTMHATCCKGLSNKLGDLRMMLDGWKEWKRQLNTTDVKHFPNAKLCPKSLHRP